MCTAISFKTKGAFFGRNLDLEYRYNETVTVTPRNFPLHFRELPEMQSHHAIIGMAFVAEGYPLYYDAMNEHGLFAAGLNFPENAVYMPKNATFENIAPFELVPRVLGQCSSAKEAKKLLARVNILNTDFSKELPNTPLHWFFADKEGSFAAEPLANGLRIYDDPLGVLTNNPPFEFQMQNLQNYPGLSPYEPELIFGSGAGLKPYSRGLGAVGLPGDLSSASRFVRAAFAKLNSLCGDSEEESVTQFFHILGAVEQQRGCVRLAEGKLEKTVYSSCASAESGIYYYKTYENSRICGVDMYRENLDGEKLVSYSLAAEQDVFIQN
ncbi:MAG: choloylglycine hydrolase [Oscillospiraceae bacterium]|nr:choloylglycine hydrolase [Oscillospiraceae bacterium]